MHLTKASLSNHSPVPVKIFLFSPMSDCFVVSCPTSTQARFPAKVSGNVLKQGFQGKVSREGSLVRAQFLGTIPGTSGFFSAGFPAKGSKVSREDSQASVRLTACPHRPKKAWLGDCMACRIMFFHICPYPSESTHRALFWEDDFCIPKNCRSTAKIGWHQKPAARAARVIVWFFSMGQPLWAQICWLGRRYQSRRISHSASLKQKLRQSCPSGCSLLLGRVPESTLLQMWFFQRAESGRVVEQKAQVCQQCVRGSATRNNAFFRASDA